jgi:hypothetical protein
VTDAGSRGDDGASPGRREGGRGGGGRRQVRRRRSRRATESGPPVREGAASSWLDPGARGERGRVWGSGLGFGAREGTSRPRGGGMLGRPAGPFSPVGPRPGVGFDFSF